MSTWVDRLYRGEPIPRLNDHELADGEIQTQSIDVWHVSDATREELHLDDDSQHFFGTEPEDLPGTVTHEPVEMTPGFSGHIGTAVFFSWYDNEVPGLVFHVDRTSVPGVIDGEYTIEFADEHPGWYGRVETLAQGEVRYDGRFVGFVNKGSVNRWGERARTRYSHGPSITDEDEWFTYETGVRLRPMLDHVVCYVHTDHGQGELDQVLGWFDGYGYFERDGPTPKYMDTDEKVRALYDEVSALMNDLSDRLRVVVLSDTPRKTTTSLVDMFEMSYDGERISRSLNGNRSLLGGSV